MRILKLKKSSGCILEVIVFDNGKTVACWQTKVPEIAIYESLEQFLSVRTKERGYEIIYDMGERRTVKKIEEHKCQYNPEVECVATDVPQICPCCHIFQEWSSKIMEMD